MSTASGHGWACSEVLPVDIPTLARQERWSLERVRALVGHCRGSVLARWADNCRRRWGSTAIERIRSRLGTRSDLLPEHPSEQAWFPVSLQIEVTDIVIDEFLGGDPAALEPLLMADIERSMGRIKRAFLRSVGPGPILDRASDLHDHLYDLGRAQASTAPGRAEITVEGSDLFGNPTWQLLQLIAHRGLIAFSGCQVQRLYGRSPDPRTFVVTLRWR